MKLKVTDLKKQLKQYNQKELIELVVELYKGNKELKTCYLVKFRIENYTI